MNNRGVALLLLSAIGFLVAVILFFATANKLQVAGNSTFLGGTEAQVLDTYLRGEQLMIFLENSARLSLGSEDFSQAFSSYLLKANILFRTDMKIEDFGFEEADDYLEVVCSKDFVLENPGVRYSVRPNFIVYR